MNHFWRVFFFKYLPPVLSLRRWWPPRLLPASGLQLRLRRQRCSSGSCPSTPDRWTRPRRRSCRLACWFSAAGRQWGVTSLRVVLLWWDVVVSGVSPTTAARSRPLLLLLTLSFFLDSFFTASHLAPHSPSHTFSSSDQPSSWPCITSSVVLLDLLPANSNLWPSLILSIPAACSSLLSLLAALHYTVLQNKSTLLKMFIQCKCTFFWTA